MYPTKNCSTHPLKKGVQLFLFVRNWERGVTRAENAPRPPARHAAKTPARSAQKKTFSVKSALKEDWENADDDD
jgi:hypothetical protein